MINLRAQQITKNVYNTLTEESLLQENFRVLVKSAVDVEDLGEGGK